MRGYDLLEKLSDVDYIFIDKAEKECFSAKKSTDSFYARKRIMIITEFIAACLLVSIGLHFVVSRINYNLTNQPQCCPDDMYNMHDTGFKSEKYSDLNEMLEVMSENECPVSDSYIGFVYDKSVGQPESSLYVKRINGYTYSAEENGYISIYNEKKENNAPIAQIEDDCEKLLYYRERLISVGTHSDDHLSNSKKYVAVNIYNAADPTDLKLQDSIRIDGAYVGCFLSKGKIYMFSSGCYNASDYKGNMADYVPTIEVNGHSIGFPYDHLYILGDPGSVKYCAYLSIDAETADIDENNVCYGDIKDVFISDDMYLQTCKKGENGIPQCMLYKLPSKLTVEYDSFYTVSGVKLPLSEYYGACRLKDPKKEPRKDIVGLEIYSVNKSTVIGKAYTKSSEGSEYSQRLFAVRFELYHGSLHWSDIDLGAEEWSVTDIKWDYSEAMIRVSYKDNEKDPRVFTAELINNRYVQESSVILHDHSI